MITPEAIESLVEEWQRESVASALEILYASGVIQTQLHIEEQKILSGPDDEPVEELAKRLLRYRFTRDALQTLQELGKTYRVTKESEQ